MICWNDIMFTHVFIIMVSWEGQASARAELVDLLEAIAFLICR